MQRISENHIVADEGMTLVRRSNGEPVGKELWLGITYWVGGEQVEPFRDVVENFDEITDEEAELQQYTYKARNALDAVVQLDNRGQWRSEGMLADEQYCDTDERKQAVIAMFGGITQTAYDSLTSALIRVSYPSDKMESIVNNYLYDMEGEHKREFEEMQKCRQRAKVLAKDIIRITSKN